MPCLEKIEVLVFWGTEIHCFDCIYFSSKKTRESGVTFTFSSIFYPNPVSDMEQKDKYLVLVSILIQHNVLVGGVASMPLKADILQRSIDI